MEPTTPDIARFGIQLYTLRDVFPQDPKGVLKQIADMGYTQIEGYEGDQGIFWGMGHTEWKNYLDSLGLTMVSTHCNINENFAEKAAQAGEIGMKYLISPWEGPQESIDDFKKIAEKFNEKGAICKENGLRFAYHNHGYSFKELDGQMPQDVMMDNTDPATVDYEMDIYWVVTGGADPIAYLNKYPDRWRLCHVKDREKGIGADVRDASVDLGTGQIDFPKILKVAAEKKMEYYIVEQERYEDSTPIESARADAEYMKNFKFAS
ncbi:sugar phosphate isomerase [Flavilitoribacter nigricans DSM 23189 = NBRC 102662]|uniref:Sugar phosphate isomerase n=2 Tax=Flavilitoribacter TaxID=2762562 RepID=A0A2D0MZ45_FLAN2|nr:sugar phosphate isomerase [Flavilitoribacter nigricans DSM 23189 = NBRC 102662]